MMTLQEAVQIFDRVVSLDTRDRTILRELVLPIDSAWLVIDGERVGVPYCCNIPVTENSQDGIARLYCDRCRREIRQVAGQWWVYDLGDPSGFREENRDGPAARKEEAEIQRRIQEAVEQERSACAQLAFQSPYPNQISGEEDTRSIVYACERAGYDMAAKAIVRAIRSRRTASLLAGGKS